MFDFIKDATFQFSIIVILTLVTIILGYLALKNRGKKALSFRLISTVPLLSIKEEIKDRIKIIYDNKEIENLHLFLFEFTNSGNVPILASDFVKPISMYFTNNSKVLSSEIVKTNRIGLDILTTISGKKISLEPTLLNPNDSFQLKILVTKGHEYFLDYRITGLEEIIEVDPKNRDDTLLIIGLFLSFILSIIGAYGFAETNNELFLGLFFVSFMGYIILTVYMGIYVVSVVSKWLLEKKSNKK